MRALVTSLQSPARVAGATQDIPTDRLLSVVDGLPNHIFRMDCKLYVQYTPHATNDDGGEELYRLIANLTIRDIASNVILKLTGDDLRDVLHAVQGWRYADPADITGGEAQATDLVHFSIPFHGGPGGVQGFREFKDNWLPVDRIRGISIEIEWASDAAHGMDATIDDAKLYISCQCVPYPAVIVGSDVRYSYLGGVPDAQQVEFPQTGLSFLYAGIHNASDRDHSDYTVVNCPDFNMLNNVSLWQLLDAWNACLAREQAMELSDTAPDFLPIMFQDRRYSVLGAMTFPQGKARVDVTNTNAATQRLCMAQVHDTYELARQLAGTRSTVFQARRSAKPIYEKKNRGSVAPRKANVLNRLLGYKLV